MKIEIIAVRKKQGEITALLTSCSYKFKRQVVHDIKNSKADYYVNNVIVKVVNKKYDYYLRTDANDIAEDNLGSLPEISEKIGIVYGLIIRFNKNYSS